MKVKAIMGFSGERFSMHAGEVRDVEENDTVKELLHIGYLEPAEAVQLAKADGIQPEKAEEAEEPKTDEVKHENKRSRAKPD